MSRRETYAALIAALLGIPLLFGFVSAMIDGERRRYEAPLRAMLGDDVFAALARGQQTELHYYGYDYRAPDFELPDRHGKPWKLSEQRGRVVVMNFWSVTCQPCIEEMPSLEQLALRARERDDLTVVAVSTDSGWDAVKAVMPPTSALTVLFDPDKSVVEGQYGTRLYPETWIIDADGVIRLRVDGPRDWGSALAMDTIERFL